VPAQPTRTLFFVTHPEVVVEPARPIPQWHLSATGMARMRAFASAPMLSDVSAIWSSTETKAVEAAGLLGAARELSVRTCAALGENDRSATGFLPPAEFEQVADAFFAEPERSVRGWERAIDAQARVETGGPDDRRRPRRWRPGHRGPWRRRNAAILFTVGPADPSLVGPAAPGPLLAGDAPRPLRRSRVADDRRMTRLDGYRQRSPSATMWSNTAGCSGLKKAQP
jgi:hypothetical protein